MSLGYVIIVNVTLLLGIQWSILHLELCFVSRKETDVYLIFVSRYIIQDHYLVLTRVYQDLRDRKAQINEQVYLHQFVNLYLILLMRNHLVFHKALYIRVDGQLYNELHLK